MLEARGTVEWEGKSSKIDPLRECGVLGFCPSCLAVMPVQRLLVGMGGAASHVALWRAVYLFFFSVTLHNVR